MKTYSTNITKNFVLRDENDPELYTPSEPAFDLKEATRFAEIMRNYVIHERASGIASPQIKYVGESTDESSEIIKKNCKLRIIAVDVDNKNGKPEIMINPEMTVSENAKTVISYGEGCLSYPNLIADVVRYKTVTVKYFDGTKYVNRVFNGNAAIQVQHEIKHLEGITIKTEAINQKSA